MLPDNIHSTEEQIAYLEAHIQFLYKYFGLSYILDLTGCGHPDVLQAIRMGDLPEALKIYGTISKSGKDTISS